MFDEEKPGTAMEIAAALGVADAVAPELAPQDVHTEEVVAEETPAEPVATEPATAEKPVEAPKPAAKPDEKLFNQDEVNAIVAQRLARAQAAAAKQAESINKLEAIAGKPLDKFVDEYRNQAAQDLADNEGVPIAEAQKRIEQSAELADLRRKQAELEAQHKQLEIQANYRAAKDKYNGHQFQSLVKEVETEVDVLSNNGAVGDFDSALYYTIGKQMVNGDLYKRMAEKIRSEVVASIGRRKGAATEGAATAAFEQEESLTPAQKQYAQLLNITHKQYADEAKKIEKARKGL